jgi:hypothetical protein
MFFDELAKLEPGRTIVQGVNNYPASICTYTFHHPLFIAAWRLTE